MATVNAGFNRGTVFFPIPDEQLKVWSLYIPVPFTPVEGQANTWFFNPEFWGTLAPGETHTREVGSTIAHAQQATWFDHCGCKVDDAGTAANIFDGAPALSAGRVFRSPGPSPLWLPQFSGLTKAVLDANIRVWEWPMGFGGVAVFILRPAGLVSTNRWQGGSPLYKLGSGGGTGTLTQRTYHLPYHWHTSRQPRTR